jgi:hypothetical protein
VLFVHHANPHHHGFSASLRPVPGGKDASFLERLTAKTHVDDFRGEPAKHCQTNKKMIVLLACVAFCLSYC